MPEIIERAAKVADWLRGTYGFSPEMNAKCVQLLKDMVEEMERLRAERDAATRWISVEERLPDEGGEYIVLVQLPNGTKDRRWDVFHPDAGWCEDYDAKVLFWMSFDSLPAPLED